VIMGFPFALLSLLLHSLCFTFRVDSRVAATE
jgi:hypothetical protein